MTKPQTLPQDHSSAHVLVESVDGFDQALAAWFSRHRGAWSGTGTELIAAVKRDAVKRQVDAGTDLWPQPGRSFFARLESHRRTLHSLGIDVLPYGGFPRLVSLRPCQEEEPGRNSPSDTLAITYGSDPQQQSHPPAEQQRTVPAVSDAVHPAEKSTHNSTLAEPVVAGDVAGYTFANADNSGSRVFANTAEALFGIVEMQDQIRERGLDLRSTMDLVASRTQELVRSSGVAVALLQNDTVPYPTRLGKALIMEGSASQATPFHSCISQGTVLLLPEAQKDPVVGASCLRAGVKSLIALPIFRNREVAGVMEVLFNDGRSFSPGDVMTLELIADVVGGWLADAAPIDAKQLGAQKSTARLRTTESTNPDSPPGAFANLKSSIPGTMAAWAAALVPRKRVRSKLK